MKMRFNAIQEEILKIAREKGFLTLEDFKKFYTSPITIKANIERFIAIGYLKESDTLGKFNFIGEKNE